MAADGELIEELEGQSVHMCHRKHGDDLVSGFQFEHFIRELGVRPEAAVGEHDSFGISGSAGGIIDDSQFFRTVLPVTDMFGAEILRITLTVNSVPVFEGVSQFLVARYQCSEIGE